MKIDKNKLANSYFDFATREHRGGYWIGRLQYYLSPFRNWTAKLGTVAFIKILFPSFPYYITFIIVMAYNIIGFYSILIIKLFIGRWDERKGIWKRHSEYNAKKEHLSPFNVELRKQLEEHTKALSELTGREIPNYLKKY